MTYVDVMMAAVPTAKKAEYTDFCLKMADVFRRHGALEVHDNWGDDVPVGKTNCLNSAVLKQDDETVAVGWILWPSKEARNAGFEAAMADPDMANTQMPFDGARMIFGGFKPVTEA